MANPKSYMKEEVKESIVEVAPAKPQVDTQAPIVLISETDAYISERMKGQPRDLNAIDVKEISSFDKPNNILALPSDLVPHAKDFAFRWINKRKRAIDHALDVVGWVLVNRVYFPNVSRHNFTSNGSIERGDSILAFMTIKRAESIRKRPIELSRERVNSTPVQDLRKWQDRGESYYKPDIGAAEDDSKKPKGLYRQPDIESEEQVEVKP